VIPDLALDEAATVAPDDGAEPARRLIEPHFAYVWRLCRRLGLSESDADDAAQQVFITASRRASDITPGRERAFLYGVAANVVAKSRHTRARRRETSHEDVEAIEADLPALDELSDQRKARVLLDALLATMELELRVVFVLYEIEELTVAEIAATLGLPAGTAASRLRRAREDFSARLARLQARRQFEGTRR